MIMLSILKARKILGKNYSHLNNEQIEILLSKTHVLADIVINLSDTRKFQSKAWFIDSQKGKLDDKAKG